ncbi:MAG TPA: DUF262 domain-containing protein [Candidatus Nanopelagicales bacterium]|nr:DUF262 domain-containing protein [Candidatus Nanopelagicales bacterium]
MRAPSFINEPQVQFLSTLLEDIRRGFVQVPRFQRPFVWTREQQESLLRSVREGIPIGAIMVWRTHRSDIACYDRLGPHQLAPPPRAEGAVHQYLLDGHQRLSTLYAALHQPDDQPDDQREDAGDTAGFRAYVDLETGGFLILKSAEELPGLGPPRMMPASLILDSVRMARMQRKLPPPDADRWITMSDDVARAFREYKIVVIPVVSEDLEMATETFRRINSQGTEMGLAHMVHVLTWSESFDLLQRLAELKELYLQPLGWQDLDDEWIINVCRVALSSDQFPLETEYLSASMREHPEALEDVVQSIGRAATFLRERCSTPSPDLVPHAAQITYLSEAFRVCPDPSERALDLLHAWLWLSTYTELLFTDPGDMFRPLNALAYVRGMVINADPRGLPRQTFERSPLPLTLDSRSARARALTARLVERYPPCPPPPSAADDAVARFFRVPVDGRRVLPPLIPWRVVSHRAHESPGNRVLVDPENAALLRNVLQGQENVPPAILDELRRIHVVSDEAFRLLRDGDLEGFIDQRRHDLDALEDDFVRRLALIFQP